MFIRPVIDGGHKATGKRLGNGTDYFSRVNWLPTDGGDMTLVCSLKYEGIASGDNVYLGGNVGSNRMIIRLGPFDVNNLYVQWDRLLDTAGATLLNSAGTAVAQLITSLLTWHSRVMTFKSATGAWETWINGVKSSGTGTAGTADWTGATWLGEWFAGSNPGKWTNISHFWLAREYVDMTTEYSKFFDGNHKPIGLGADGSLPTGRQPEHFAPGGNLAVNLGTESNWTKNGTIADSADSPTD